jgi:hypothetical protein
VTAWRRVLNCHFAPEFCNAKDPMKSTGLRCSKAAKPVRESGPLSSADALSPSPPLPASSPYRRRLRIRRADARATARGHPRPASACPGDRPCRPPMRRRRRRRSDMIAEIAGVSRRSFNGAPHLYRPAPGRHSRWRGRGSRTDAPTSSPSPFRRARRRSHSTNAFTRSEASPRSGARPRRQSSNRIDQVRTQKDQGRHCAARSDLRRPGS